MGFEKLFSTECCCSTFSFPFGMTNIVKILGLCSELMREKVVLWGFSLFLILPPAVLWRLSNTFLFVKIPPVTSVPKDAPGGRTCKRSPTSFPDGVTGTILGKIRCICYCPVPQGFIWCIWMQLHGSQHGPSGSTSTWNNHTSKKSWNQSCFCLNACELADFQRWGLYPAECCVFGELYVCWVLWENFLYNNFVS